MVSGSFDKRVTFSKTQKVFDGRGGWTEKETALGSFWVAVNPVTVSQQANYSAMDMEVDMNVTMRFHPDIDEKCTFTFRGTKYKVVGVINPGFSDEYLQLVVSEV